jgi:hypothetical protein
MKKQKQQTYSFLTGLEKSIMRVIVIAGPMLLMILPEVWMNVTLGAVITFVINFAKNYRYKWDA